MQKTADWLRLKACFGAGTPIRTPGGWINIEEIREGDMVLSRDEHEPKGLVESKRVEELYVRTAPILKLQINGQEIKTTAEHPFYAFEKGWTNAGELTADDQLLDIDGRWHLVQAVVDTGEWTTVYNFRVQDHHTYFVGRDDWGWSVWAHNAECTLMRIDRESAWTIVGKDGQIVPSAVGKKFGNPTNAYRFAEENGYDIINIDKKIAYGARARDSDLLSAGEYHPSSILIDPHDFTPTHFANRYSSRKFEAFKLQIKELGFRDSHSPILYVVHNNRKYILNGHHRIRAAKELGISRVPAQEVSLPYGQYKNVDDLAFDYNSAFRN